jgi:hypothetical protein
MFGPEQRKLKSIADVSDFVLVFFPTQIHYLKSVLWENQHEQGLGS